MTDPNIHATEYRYDKSKRKTQEIYPGKQTHRYNYDVAGNLIETPDRPTALNAKNPATNGIDFP